MRTSAYGAVLAALLLAPVSARAESWAQHFELGLAPEITLVGLSGGARAQVLWRPGGPRTVSRLLLAPGVLSGPEFDYVPVALGYRAVFRPDAIFRPLIGAGIEYQHRWVDDAPAARQFAVYLELGSMFTVAPHWSLGFAAGMDATLAGGLGFGLLGRLIVVWTPTPPR